MNDTKGGKHVINLSKVIVWILLFSPAAAYAAPAPYGRLQLDSNLHSDDQIFFSRRGTADPESRVI
jgi:hypothetical protein